MEASVTADLAALFSGPPPGQAGEASQSVTASEAWIKVILETWPPVPNAGKEQAQAQAQVWGPP